MFDKLPVVLTPESENSCRLSPTQAPSYPWAFQQVFHLWPFLLLSFPPCGLSTILPPAPATFMLPTAHHCPHSLGHNSPRLPPPKLGRVTPPKPLCPWLASPQHVTPCSLLLTVCAPDVFYSCCSSHLKCTHIASPMLSEPRHTHTHTHTHTPLKAIPRPPTRSPRASQHFLCSWACNVTPTVTNIYNPLPRARLCTRFFSFHRLIQTAAV